MTNRQMPENEYQTVNMIMSITRELNAAMQQLDDARKYNAPSDVIEYHQKSIDCCKSFLKQLVDMI